MKAREARMVAAHKHGRVEYRAEPKLGWGYAVAAAERHYAVPEEREAFIAGYVGEARRAKLVVAVAAPAKRVPWATEHRIGFTAKIAA